jgi:hypothetical protein
MSAQDQTPKEALHFFYEKEGEILKGDGRLFQHMFGATLIEEIYSHPGDLKTLSTQQTAKECNLDRLFSQSYFAHVKNKRSVYLKQCPIQEAGWNLHANQLFPKGSCVAEYVGALRDPTQGSSYAFGPYDASNFRGMGAFIADGFPNVIPIFLFEKRGVPLRIAFIATEDIPPNEPICFNYGLHHSVKGSLHIEFREQAMLAYFQKWKLSSLILEVKKLLEQERVALNFNGAYDHKGTLKLEDIICKLQYLFQTKSAQELAIQAGVLTQDEIASSLSDVLFKKNVLLV